MIHAPERVETIRRNVATKLKVISDLEAQIKDAYILGRLQQVRNWFGDVESVFLSSLSRESRTPEGESYWLSGAETALQMATQQLKSIQEVVAQYGSNITTI